MNPQDVRVAVIGATGYTGVELLRILARHPRVAVAMVTSEHHQGKRLSEVHPSLGSFGALTLQSVDLNQIREAAEIAFVALPAGSTFSIIPDLVRAGVRVIDLGPDFRLANAEVYQKYYGAHQATEMLLETVYGLTEIHRDRVSSARLVGNPGCYPTAVILALAPLLRKGLVSGEVVVDAKSGVSGAGRGGGIDLAFCEVHETMKAYSVARHRHLPEMEEEFAKLSGLSLDIVFVPHLVPMNRGILATSYVTLTRAVDAGEMASLYRECYGGEPFVRIKNPGEFPETREVKGTNVCSIGIHADPRRQRAVVVSAIDNLVKGASGQAVQNMNRMKGFPETEGLVDPGMFP